MAARRLAPFALPVALLAALGAWWGRGSSETSDALGSGSAARGGGGAAPLAAPASGEAPAEATARSADPAVASRVEATSPAEAAAPAVTLHGTLVGIDVDGAERPALDGRFKAWFARGEERVSADVTVSGGRFDAGVPPGGPIVVTDIELGGRAGRVDYTPVPVSATGEVALRIELIPASILRVLDAGTRAPLAGIDLHVDPEFLRGSRLYPGFVRPTGAQAPPCVAAASSPVTLPPFAGQPVWWIHVAGHAWTRQQIQQEIGGEREVLLERGGTLALTLRDVTPRAAIDLVITRGDLAYRELLANGSEPYDPAGVPADLPSAPFTLQRDLADFPPGPIAVAARAGGTVLASATAEVRAGEVTRVELRLGPAQPEPPWVALRGTVHGIDAELAPEFGIRLERADVDAAERLEPTPQRGTFTADRDRPGSVRFDYRVPPRRYVLTVLPVQVHRLLEVGPQGLVDVEIELPSLVEVQVEVVDRASGLPIAGGMVSWRTADHPVPDANYPQAAGAAPDGKPARFRAPAGRIVVQAWPDGYAPSEREIELHPPFERITLEVAREQAIRIVLRDGDANVPIDPGALEFDLRRADGSSARTGWARDIATGALSLTAADAGDFTLVIPPIPGFLPVRDRAVHVEPGGTTEVVIELARR